MAIAREQDLAHRVIMGAKLECIITAGLPPDVAPFKTAAILASCPRNMFVEQRNGAGAVIGLDVLQGEVHFKTVKIRLRHSATLFGTAAGLIDEKRSQRRANGNNQQ